MGTRRLPFRWNGRCSRCRKHFWRNHKSAIQPNKSSDCKQTASSDGVWRVQHRWSMKTNRLCGGSQELSCSCCLQGTKETFLIYESPSLIARWWDDACTRVKYCILRLVAGNEGKYTVKQPHRRHTLHFWDQLVKSISLLIPKPRLKSTSWCNPWSVLKICWLFSWLIN